METFEFMVQSTAEVKMRDLILTPKSSSEMPAISEGFALFLLMNDKLKAKFFVGAYRLLARMLV